MLRHPGLVDAPGAPVAVHLANRRAPCRLRLTLGRHRPESGDQVGRWVKLDRAGVRTASPAQLPHDRALFGDEVGVGLQPGGALLLMLAELASLLARLVCQFDRGRKLRPARSRRAELADVLFTLGLPLGGTFGLVVAVAWRLAERVVQAVTLD